MVCAWFDIHVHDDIDMAVDEINSVPGATTFYGDTGVLLVDSFCGESQGINSLVEFVKEVLGEK